MIDPKTFDLDIKPRETAWALDPDVDPDASDFSAWEKTGDGLVARERGRLAVIRWRPLTLPEQGAIGAQLRVAGLRDMYSERMLCVAYGLVSVEGLELGTEAVPTGRRIKADGIARFEQLRGDVPTLGEVSPIVWLGGLIFDASFREAG